MFQVFVEPRKKKKYDPLEDSFLKMNSAIQTWVNSQGETSIRDAEDHFGELVASEIKKKSLEQQKILKMKIMELIYKE